MRQTLFLLLAFTLFTCSDAGDIKNSPSRNTLTRLYQISTLEALKQGVYDGDKTIDEIKDLGNFGLGTFKGLDGEMVVLDGEFHQVEYSGKVIENNYNTPIPFINIVQFHEEDSFTIEEDINELSRLTEAIKARILWKKYIYAVKIEALFDSVQCRSVEKQDPPYPLLAEVIKNQSVFNKKEVKGTVVGFIFPDYMGGVNTTGAHFHFINDERNFGGHLLNLKGKNFKVTIDRVESFTMDLLTNENYQTN